jgi:hypothetical protein
MGTGKRGRRRKRALNNEQRSVRLSFNGKRRGPVVSVRAVHLGNVHGGGKRYGIDKEAKRTLWWRHVV